ncbi:MAG: tripartite tricarboxylate transporter permease [Candidatus Methylomirabilales bacterium]
MLMAPPLARLALKFGPPEYFTLFSMALIIVASMGSGDPLKALMMVAFGLTLGTVGTDQVTGNPRFALNIRELQDGVGIAPVAIGVLGISEVLLNVERMAPPDLLTTSLRGILPSLRDLRDSWLPMLRGSVLGFFIGILPGGNPIISSFLSYGMEKKLSKHPQRFGHGAVEGLAGPEAANNATTSGAFVPLLSLGVPNNAVMALMLGAIVIHGIIPGPNLITEKPQLFWGVLCQSLLLGKGRLSIFVTRPIAATFLAVSAIFLIRTAVSWGRDRRRKPAAAAP